MIQINLSKKLLAFFTCLLLFSCSSYQKVLKSPDLKLKYDAALKYYDDANYFKAMPLFEELLTTLRGTANAEKVYYYFAYCQFHTEQYELASYHFQNLVNTFPRSTYAEECQFMVAFCYYSDSPETSLDQSNTYRAINELQLFINKYPNSGKKDQCNQLIDMLREKLEEKSFNAGNLYYNMGNFNAAQVSFKNLIHDFPNTKYKEEAMFISFKAAYEYAVNSIDEKKPERFKLAKDSFLAFSDTYPKSLKMKEAQNLYENVKKNTPTPPNN
jgi:outer membrane protein assembly factor BamD